MGRLPKKYSKTIEDYYRKDEGILINEGLIDYWQFFNDWEEWELDPINKVDIPDVAKEIYHKFLTEPIKPQSILQQESNREWSKMSKNMDSIRADYNNRPLEDKIGIASNMEDVWKEQLVYDLAEEWCWGPNTEKRHRIENYVKTTFSIMGSPVRVPCWLFASENMLDENLRLTNIEKVALSHALHFLHTSTGYMECSGGVELWCRCSVEEAHNAFQSLYKKALVQYVPLHPKTCYGLIRNMGWKANVPALDLMLEKYGRRFDS